MPDVEVGERKKKLKKKHLQIFNILKESVGATTITKHILDKRVNLTIGKLRASALVVEKQPIKAITEDEAVQFWIKTLESNIADA